MHTQGSVVVDTVEDKEARSVTIRVMDTGPGFTTEQVQKINAPPTGEAGSTPTTLREQEGTAAYPLQNSALAEGHFVLCFSWALVHLFQVATQPACTCCPLQGAGLVLVTNQR